MPILCIKDVKWWHLCHQIHEQTKRYKAVAFMPPNIRANVRANKKM